MVHLGEGALQLRDELAASAALKHLGEERSPGFSTSSARSSAASTSATTRKWSVDRCPVAGAAMSESTTSARPSLSAARIAAGASSALHLASAPRRRGAARSGLRSTASTCPFLGRADPLRCDLAPPSRCCAEIEHDHARLKEAVSVVNLGELERSARAIAAPLRLLDIRIIELALQPTGRGDLPPLRRAELHCGPGCRRLSLTYHLLMRHIGPSP